MKAAKGLSNRAPYYLILYWGLCVSLVSSHYFRFLQACMSDDYSQQCSLPPSDIVSVPGPKEVGAGGGRTGTKEPSALPLCALRAPTL